MSFVKPRCAQRGGVFYASVKRLGLRKNTFALRFNRQSLDQMTGVLGLRGEYGIQMDAGLLSPSFRAEYRAALSGSSKAQVAYADWLASPIYQIGVATYDDRRLMLGLGLRWTGINGWSFSADADSSVADNGGDALGVRVNASGKF